MPNYKLKCAIDLLDKQRAVSRQYGTVTIEADARQTHTEKLKQTLQEAYKPLFKPLKVVNVEILDMIPV